MLLPVLHSYPHFCLLIMSFVSISIARFFCKIYSLISFALLIHGSLFIQHCVKIIHGELPFGISYHHSSGFLDSLLLFTNFCSLTSSIDESRVDL